MHYFLHSLSFGKQQHYSNINVNDFSFNCSLTAVQMRKWRVCHKDRVKKKKITCIKITRWRQTCMFVFLDKVCVVWKFSVRWIFPENAPDLIFLLANKVSRRLLTSLKNDQISQNSRVNVTRMCVPCPRGSCTRGCQKWTIISCFVNWERERNIGSTAWALRLWAGA